MKIYTPLFILWVAITLPVLLVGYFIYQDNHLVRPVEQVKTQTVVVTPTVEVTATPSATPKFLLKATVVAPTGKGGVK